MKKFSSIMRGNSRRTSQDKKIRHIVILCLVACALFLGVPKAVSFAASMILMPIHTIQTWLASSADSFPEFFRDREELISELNALKLDQSSQGGDRLTIGLLSKENEELRTLLGDNGGKRILAGVIGRPNMLPYDVLVLDKGSDDGLVEGAPVFVGKSTVIGVVGKVFKRDSIVELITTPGFTASVYILGPDIYTNAVGIGGGQMRVGVPQGIKLAEGDLVVLPGVTSGVYGAISIVQSVPTEPEQYGYVSPNIPIAGLHYVTVGSIPLQPVTFDEAQKVVSDAKNLLFMVPVPDHVLITTDAASSSKAATSSDLLP